MTSSSTALARIEPPPTDKPEAEKVAPASSITVPAALLLAAEAVSAKPGASPNTYLEGVYLHAKGDRGRVVGTDGARMFIASFALPTAEQGGTPPWMRNGGVILSGDGLRSRIALLGKLTGDRGVVVSHATGSATVEVSDNKGHSVFKLKALPGTYPNYEAAIGAHSFSALDDEGNPEGREWQPVGINSTYLKQCGDIAKMLEAGLEASERSKLGMVVRAFNGGAADAPLVFDFSTWPGAILVMAPAVMATRVASQETARLLAPAVKATVAALRAHATRWEQRAGEATDATAKAEAEAKAASFRKRVADVLLAVPAGPALTGSKPAKAAPAQQDESKADDAPKPQAEPAPDPKVEAQAKPDPEPDPSGDDEAAAEGKRPKTKRTRIHVNQAAA